MVEMQETACILHAATSRSLVILDEMAGAPPRSRARAWPGPWPSTSRRNRRRRRPGDALRHPLPRAHRSGRRDAGRRQLSRGSARMNTTNRLSSAKVGAWTFHSELRNPGRAAEVCGLTVSVSRAATAILKASSRRMPRGGNCPPLSGAPTARSPVAALFQAPADHYERIDASEVISITRLRSRQALNTAGRIEDMGGASDWPNTI